MKIAALVHMMTPYQNAGSEMMVERMMAACVPQHEVRIFVTAQPPCPDVYTHAGFTVARTTKATASADIAEFAPDVLLTHHSETTNAALICDRLGIPCVFLVHNNHAVKRLSLPHAGVIYNTEWIRREHTDDKPSIVIHPPVEPSEHATPRGDCVTLVNLNASKGASIFYQIAERVPERKFLGVIGNYGAQIICRYPNLDIVPNTRNMPGDVWSRTGLLVMPSGYESYGMAAVEAAASGIPTIAAPTPGLKEALGSAGTYVNRDDVDDWVREVRRLSDPTEYRYASEAAESRSNRQRVLWYKERADFVIWLEEVAR